MSFEKHNSRSEREDLLNPHLRENTKKQKCKIDYSALGRIDSLELRLESDKSTNGNTQISEKVFQEVFKEQIPIDELIRRTWNRTTNRRLVRITRIDFLFKTSDFVNLQDFWGMWFDSPQKGIQSNNSSILLAGWILGKIHRVSTIRILHDGKTVGETSVNLSRPDVAEKYFFVPDAHNSGFCIALNVEELPWVAHLTVQAVFSNGHSLLVGAIQYCRS
jgi:hypothetical protein